MIAAHTIWIARELLLLALTAAVLVSFLGSADQQRKAKLLPDGALEFAPNRRAFLAWPCLVGYLFYATVVRLTHVHGEPLNFAAAIGLGILAVMFAISFPEKIVLTAEGLEQVSWLWKSKHIRWADIVEVNAGGKGRIVTITAADGTKIIHNRQLPDRLRILMELKDHCGKNLPADFPQEANSVP